MTDDQNRNSLLTRLNKNIANGTALEVQPPWPEFMQIRPATTHSSSEWFVGAQLTSVVYQTTDSILRFDDLPYDEQVVVLAGSITLTSKEGESETFVAGDTFALAKGWSGTWEMRDGYRELATFESNAVASALEGWGF